MADYNFLHGAITTKLGQLSSLQFLNLSSNQLTRSIPVALTQLTNLTTLALGNPEKVARFAQDYQGMIECPIFFIEVLFPIYTSCESQLPLAKSIKSCQTQALASYPNHISI